MLSIVIPTYNEKNNIQPLIERIGAALTGVTEYEIIFVDDSSDDTPELIRALSLSDNKIRFIHRVNEKGLASAVVQGFSMAKGELIAVMDADLQHPPETLLPMLQAIEDGADIVLPSRYIRGGRDRGLNLFRKLISNTAKWIGIIMLKPLRNISDPTGGFFMMRRKVIDGRPLHPMGWKILIEVLVMGSYAHVAEIPYEFYDRNAEESKMSAKIALQYFGHIFSLTRRSRRERIKRKRQVMRG